MAHECPECGMICHCGKDIDDALLNFDEDVENCDHYKECEKDEEDYPDDE